MANSDDAVTMHVDWAEGHSGPTEWVPASALEALAAEVRELRRDRARLDWVFANDDIAHINIKGAYDWDAVLNREELDAAMGGGEGEAKCESGS